MRIVRILRFLTFLTAKKLAFMLVASMRHPNHPDTIKSLVVLIYS